MIGTTIERRARAGDGMLEEQESEGCVLRASSAHSPLRGGL